MSTIIIELPETIQQQIEEKQEPQRFILEAAALEGYRQELLSRGQVSELLGMSFGQTEAFLDQHQAHLHYDIHDFENDLKNLSRLQQVPA